MTPVVVQWLGEAETVLRALLGANLSNTGFGLTLGAGLLTLLIVVRLVAHGSGAAMVTVPRVLLFVVLAMVILLGAVVALRLYVIPHLQPTPATRWLPLVLCGLLTLAVVVPLMRTLLAGRYFPCLFTLVLTAAAVAGVVLLVHAALGAFRSGDAGFNKTRSRRDTVNETILGK